MTKDNWIKAFDNVFSHTGLHNRIFGYGVETRLKDFISQVEKDAEERGYQLGLRDGIKKEHENSRAWTDLNKQGVINTHKLINDAIEKTNKRWRERIEWMKKKYKDSGSVEEHTSEIIKFGYNQALSDLLEDKK